MNLKSIVIATLLSSRMQPLEMANILDLKRLQIALTVEGVAECKGLELDNTGTRLASQRAATRSCSLKL